MMFKTWLETIEQEKDDILKIRTILRNWITGKPSNYYKNLPKFEHIFAKFKPKSNILLYRNSTEDLDEFTRPTSWSYDKLDAQTFAGGRTLISHLFSPNDIIVSIPHVESLIRKLKFKSIDILNQHEVIIKPKPWS